MQPVVAVEEMAKIDAAATVPVETLIERAGAAVARTALDMMGGGYGRRVVVIAGKGNNGADGRAAARRLQRRGVRCLVIEAASAPSTLPPSDLVIDAAYGTGFRGDYVAPDPVGARVLAVDIPSGIDGNTGMASGAPATADRTVTFAAYKPGLLLGDGPGLAGQVEVADIGLAVDIAADGRPTIHLIDDADVANLIPTRDPAAHKWHHAVRVVAGSPGMAGAAALTASAAMRAGAGYVRLGMPGVAHRADGTAPVEAVTDSLSAEGWSEPVLADLDRFGALVVGPGLGRSADTLSEVRLLIERSPVPIVIDADALAAYEAIDGAPFASRAAGTVLTPHDGEFETLTGWRPGPDRIDACRALARRSGATVLLKGTATVIADPDGDVLLVTAGSPRLATAGTGDVLSGLIGAMLAGGLLPDLAAAMGAQIHGRAASIGYPLGMVASDLLELVPLWLERNLT